MFPQSVADVERFKTRTNLEIESIADVKLDSVGVTATPTLLLVSRDGSVVRSWVGSEGRQVQDAIYSVFVNGR